MVSGAIPPGDQAMAKTSVSFSADPDLTGTCSRTRGGKAATTKRDGPFPSPVSRCSRVQTHPVVPEEVRLFQVERNVDGLSGL